MEVEEQTITTQKPNTNVCQPMPMPIDPLLVNAHLCIWCSCVYKSSCNMSPCLLSGFYKMMGQFNAYNFYFIGTIKCSVI